MLLIQYPAFVSMRLPWFFLLVTVFPAAAQISPASNGLSIRADGSVSTTVTSADSENFTITDGQAAGNNLFHSFTDFSIPEGGSATFNNASDILNIISRVTGDRTSNIQGILSAQGTANLFLINPNGIVFGQNAELDIGGSFIGSTAESVLFPNNVRFSAANTQSNPLLSISAPLGLQMGRDAGAIQVTDNGYQTLAAVPFTINSSSGLQVDGGQSLVLIGNGVTFVGGKGIAPGGLIAIGSVESGQVNLAENSWVPSYEDVTAFGNIDMSARSLLNASNGIHDAKAQRSILTSSGGDIQLQGRQLSARDSSIALIQNFGTQTSGDIRVNASEKIELATADSTALIGSGFVTTSFAQSSVVHSVAPSLPVSSLGGNIHIVSPVLTLIDDGIITTEAFGTVPGGDININVSSATLNDINSPNPAIRGGIHSLSYSPVASGIAGNINVTVKDNLTVFGDGISSQAVRNADSGTVHVTSDVIKLQNGSSIASVTLNQGNGGELVVTAQDIWIDGITPTTFFPSGILATSVAAGDAGNVTVNTQRLSVAGGGRVGASTVSTGNAGQVTINAAESVQVSGTIPGSINPSLIISGANVVDPPLRLFLENLGVKGIPPVPEGDAGDVTINTPLLTVTEGAQITVRNDGTGNAGELRVNAQFIFLRDRAGITASTELGGGGNLSINADNVVLLRNESRLSAEAKGTGDGGNITISTANLVALENSDIIANAEAGQGGNIQINAQDILGTRFRETLTNQSDITASSQFGSSGVVELNTTNVSAGSGLTQLPQNVDDNSRHVVAGCSEAESGQFIATGRGGLAVGPTQTLSSNSIWTDIREPELDTKLNPPIANETYETTTYETTTSGTTTHASVVNINAVYLSEAIGWANNSKGDIVLYATEQSLYSPSATSCSNLSSSMDS
ncbi:MAG: filamentous hemagglutinin N-terminal domain-containing protein [Cyanobacteria bacterium J06621_11]